MESNKSLVFGFCIYGTNLKYYEGLHENLKIITTHPFFQDKSVIKSVKTYIIYSPTAKPKYISLYKTFPNIILCELPTEFTDIPRMSRLSFFDTLDNDDYFISRVLMPMHFLCTNYTHFGVGDFVLRISVVNTNELQ
jgi:hypothetical protein